MSLNHDYSLELRRTLTQKFPAVLIHQTWRCTIPVPPHIIKLLLQFITHERHAFINNFKRIIGFPRRACDKVVTCEPRDPRDLDLGETTVQHVLSYKLVDRKVRPVPGVTPEHTKVSRQFPSDPLAKLPKLPVNPPEFVPSKKLTQERMDSLKLNENQELTLEEQKLLQHILLVNERSIAFEENERGTFRQDYFSDYQISCMEHEPWVEKNIPIPPGYQEEILRLLREKIEGGVYEPTQSSYRSKQFCVKKKNGDLRIVHNLQKLNSITIRDTGVPPILDEFVERFAGWSIYSVLDMYWGFYARIMDPRSRDLTAFQTPLGTLRIVSLPMGFTNSPAEFQACMMFILKEEICNQKAGVFIDDIPVNGPRSQYLDQSGKPEVLPETQKFRDMFGNT